MGFGDGGDGGGGVGGVEVGGEVDEVTDGDGAVDLRSPSCRVMVLPVGEVGGEVDEVGDGDLAIELRSPMRVGDFDVGIAVGVGELGGRGGIGMSGS